MMNEREIQNMMEMMYGSVEAIVNKHLATSNQKYAIKRAAEVRKIDISHMDVENITVTEANDLLKWLNSKRIPLSERQIEVIKKNCERLEEPYPDFDSLEGGWNNSGAAYIAAQIEKIKTMPKKVTDNMKMMIKRFRICIDIEPYCTGIDENSYEEVKALIDRFAGEYEVWYKDCPTREQMQTMIDLNNKMQTPWDYQALMNLRRSMADEYISQLRRELAEHLWTIPTTEEKNLLGNLEVEAAMTHEEVKNSKNKDDEEVIRDEMSKLIFGISAISGEPVDTNMIETMNMDSIMEYIMVAKEKFEEETKDSKLIKSGKAAINSMIDSCKVFDENTKLILKTL